MKTRNKIAHKSSSVTAQQGSIRKRRGRPRLKVEEILPEDDIVLPSPSSDEEAGLVKLRVAKAEKSIQDFIDALNELEDLDRKQLRVIISKEDAGLAENIDPDETLFERRKAWKDRYAFNSR